MLVQPSKDGKRPGYRFAFDRGKETKADKGVDKGDGPSQRQREQSRFEDQSYSNPNKFATKEDVREQARVGNQIKEGDFLSPATTIIGGRQFNVIPGDDRNVQERILAENIQKRIDKQNRDKFINTKTNLRPTGLPVFDVATNFINRFLPSQVTRKFYYDNVRGRTVTLPDGSVITFDEDNYDEYDALRKAGVIGAYGNTEMGQNAIDARGGPDDQILFPDLEDMPGGPKKDSGDGDDGDDENTQTGSGQAFRLMSRGGSPMDAPKKEGIMMASYDYDDAMNEAFEEFLRLKKIKEIPEDMEFDEYLDQLDIDVPYSKKDKGEQRAMAQEGGIMDLETGRQMYFLGKLVKKATRAVKKITKSPLGKAALGVAALKFGPSFFGTGSFNPLKAITTTFGPKGPMKQTGLSGLGRILNKLGLADTAGGLTTFGKFGIPLALLPFLTEEEKKQIASDRGVSIDPGYIRGNPYTFASNVGSGSGTAFALAADGGRIGYQEGSKEPVAKKTMPLLDLDGKEMDLRDDGGFVPIGRMEKADDVPARLSKNEFVFTADAVRNAGGGDVDKGAEVMYNMMKNLESGGEVSEESQGLEGAREMFQTSKRLEEVL